MNITAVFDVVGRPRPAGSKRGFAIRNRAGYTGKVAMVDQSGKEGEAWRADVRAMAVESGATPVEGPVTLLITFRLLRPKSHYRSGKNDKVLKDGAPMHHTQTPDLCKLVRSVEDALKGIAWVDDQQVVHHYTSKEWACRWGNKNEGATITVVSM